MQMEQIYNDINGVPTAHVVIPREQTETLQMGHNIRLPGAELVTESHPDEEEIYIILRGEGRLVLGQEERLIRAGEAVYVPRNTEHGMAAAGDAPLEYLYIACWPDKE